MVNLNVELEHELIRLELKCYFSYLVCTTRVPGSAASVLPCWPDARSSFEELGAARGPDKEVGAEAAVPLRDRPGVRRAERSPDGVTDLRPISAPASAGDPPSSEPHGAERTTASHGGAAGSSQPGETQAATELAPRRYQSGPASEGQNLFRPFGIVSCTVCSYQSLR